MLILCIGAFTVLMACDLSGVPLVSQAQPTATARATTRTRATFTPRPKVTNTPLATATEQATETPTDEPVTSEPATPTKKPVTVKPTVRPATKVPPPPAATPIPPATKNPYQYSFIKSTCEHSGGVHIFIVVFANYKDPGSQVAGRRVIASYAPDSPAFGDTVGVTNEEGLFDYVMSPDGAAPWTGTVYAWVVDANNNRISQIGGPVQLNGKNEDAPDTCWIAKFFFAGGK